MCDQSISIGDSFSVTVNTASAVSTNAMSEYTSGKTAIVRLCGTVDCWVAVGANPTAANDGTSMYLPAKIPTTIRCPNDYKIAAIAGGEGTLYATVL